MFVLGIDTSTNIASVAISKNNVVLYSKNTQRGFSHSDALLPMIDECLTKAECSISDIELIGVVTGPGSFTGLRIGLSTVMGLAMPDNIFVIPLSSLEIMAFTSDIKDIEITPYIYSYRNEFYTSKFINKNGNWTRLEPDKIIISDLLVENKIKFFVEINSNPTIILEQDINYSSGKSACILANLYNNNKISAKLLAPEYLHNPTFAKVQEQL